jgi:hypothetical protein
MGQLTPVIIYCNNTAAVYSRSACEYRAVYKIYKTSIAILMLSQKIFLFHARSIDFAEDVVNRILLHEHQYAAHAAV